MLKFLGIVILAIVSYIVFAAAFDPWGYGAEHDARMKKAHEICVNELGITRANGHSDHALHKCTMNTADFIKRGGNL